MWNSELEELKRRKKIAHGLGGEKNIAKQHARGKMTVRERIDILCDRDTFLERGILSGAPTYDDRDPHNLKDLVPCPFVMGLGRIDGRRIAVHGDDFTIKGSLGGENVQAQGGIFCEDGAGPSNAPW